MLKCDTLRASVKSRVLHMPIILIRYSSNTVFSPLHTVMDNYVEGDTVAGRSCSL